MSFLYTQFGVIYHRELPAYRSSCNLNATDLIIYGIFNCDVFLEEGANHQL